MPEKQQPVQPDPWDEAAKNFHAQPGETAAAPGSADDDWKIWQQGGGGAGTTPSGGLTEIRPNQSDTLPHALEDTFSNIGAGGLGTLATLGRISPWGALADHMQGKPTIYEDAYQAVTHPKETGQGLVHALKDVAQHPLENVAGAIGAAGAGGMIPEGANLVAKIPTRAKAGALFDQVMARAGDEPVTLTKALAPMERAQQLSARGGGTISPIDNLYKRINTINPLDYKEARDWASNLSRLSANDKMNASPALMAEAKKLSHALNEDIGGAAARRGVGPQYEQAMDMYSRASRLREGLKNTAKWGVPIAAGGGVVGTVLKKALQ